MDLNGDKSNPLQPKKQKKRKKRILFSHFDTKEYTLTKFHSNLTLTKEYTYNLVLSSEGSYTGVGLENFSVF